MIKLKLRVILWAGVILFAGALMPAYWVISLFNQLDMVTAQRMLSKPIRYYSDITVLKAGQALSAAGLEERLRERGYRLEKAGELAEGNYRFLSGAGEPGSPAGKNGLEVFFRPYIAPDGRAIAGLYKFVFQNGSLSLIEQAPVKTVKEAILEPMELGDTRGGGAELRPWVRLEKIPKHLKAAVLDSEDRRFYSHPGVDPLGIARAMVVNLVKGGVHQGGSTLTQQLVRNAFLSQERTFSRKITEAAIALIIEFRYDKDRIFELYLNQIYLGQNGLHQVYGVEDASLSYFGKHAQELSLSECALLVGLIPSPNRSNPRVNPALAFERRDNVIKTLLKCESITFDEAQEAFRETPVYAPVTNQGIGAYYIDWVRQQLAAAYGSEALESRGYKVITAIDPELEKEAEKALLTQHTEGALVALDAYTGYVRALAGGLDFGRSPFNRAVLARRSPGSALKPIIFAAALELKYFKADSILQDKPVKITSAGRIWEPQNYDLKYMGDITFRDALVLSRNIPAIEVFQQIGAARLEEFARKMGIESEMTLVPSLALGTSDVTPLEMTASYAPFANGGFSVKPIFIRWITDQSGRVIKDNKPELKEAISAETASQITDMLKDAVNRGTGRNVRNLGYTGPAAGKTGTSDYFYDAWFIGYTPEILCGVWLGDDKPASLGNTASVIAVPVWTEFIKSIPAPEIHSEFGKKRPTGLKGFFSRLLGL